MTYSAPPFTHLRHLTDAGGLFEHARGVTPRREHGYCVDDVARGLVVTCRETGQGGAQPDLVAHYLDFVLAAQDPAGGFVNRRAATGDFHGPAVLDDCWGRALWGLGAVVASGADAESRRRAMAGFARSAQARSPWPHAMTFAALGAANVLRSHPEDPAARALLAAAATQIGPAGALADWPWPLPRLTYANAALPEVLMAAGELLGRPDALADGLALLGWLLETETRGGHLSVTPVGGRGPGESGPGFDQQPIEAATLADACARAFRLTGQGRWARGIEQAASWFYGANDTSIWLYDPHSGGCCDGLERAGRNDNQGAESTLAFISTLQQARWLALCRA